MAPDHYLFGLLSSAHFPVPPAVLHEMLGYSVSYLLDVTHHHNILIGTVQIKSWIAKQLEAALSL